MAHMPINGSNRGTKTEIIKQIPIIIRAMAIIAPIFVLFAIIPTNLRLFFSILSLAPSSKVQENQDEPYTPTPPLYAHLARLYYIPVF